MAVFVFVSLLVFTLEIALIHRELHAVWAAQIEVCELLWAVEPR
jgi:hypothetical protein